MRRLLPPLNPLRAFEAAGRHVSFTRAAEELGVTQTAVSRQVVVLESFLRSRLFERHNSELVLTDAGRAYLLSIQPALESIAAATENARGRATNVLKVRAYLTFALRWLLPRLHRFREAHPNIEINLTTSLTLADFERDDIDVNICYGDGAWSGVSASEIFADSVTAVGSPKLFEGPGAPKTAEDLLKQNLLHSRNRAGDWQEWFDFAGVDGRVPQGLTLETSSLVYEGAKQGLGFAIGQVQLLRDDIDNNVLVAPFPVLHRQRGYYLLHRQGRIEPKTQKFRAWVMKEVAADEQVKAA